MTTIKARTMILTTQESVAWTCKPKNNYLFRIESDAVLPKYGPQIVCLYSEIVWHFFSWSCKNATIFSSVCYMDIISIFLVHCVPVLLPDAWLTFSQNPSTTCPWCKWWWCAVRVSQNQAHHNPYSYGWTYAGMLLSIQQIMINVAANSLLI